MERVATKEDIERIESQMKEGFIGTHNRQDHTNGTVSTHSKMLWTSLGALPLLTIWAWWATQAILDEGKSISNVERLEIQAAVAAGIDNAFSANEAYIQTTPNK